MSLASYSKVVAKRVGDHVPQLLRENFVTAVVDEYESCVFREMMAKGLSNYMREDPQQGQYRARGC